MSKYERREIDEANLAEIYKEAVGEEEDIEFLKKRLGKALDDQKALEIENERLKEEKTQLSQVVKKDSFKKASEVEGEKYELVIDEKNTEHLKPMDINQILARVVSPLRNRKWNVVELWARFVK